MTFQELQTRLNINLPDDILQEALTHRSILNDKTQRNTKHNERLEFLGDAVLELITSDYFYKKYSDKTEGELTNYRSAVVNRTYLASIAKELGIGKAMILSHGERSSGGEDKPYLLANALEAILGAIYITSGMPAAVQFVHTYVLSKEEELITMGYHLDAKTTFQELSQADLRITPHYEVMKEEGLDHDKTFTVGAFVGDKQVGTGIGNSKKTAQMAAAEDALIHRSDW